MLIHPDARSSHALIHSENFYCTATNRNTFLRNMKLNVRLVLSVNIVDNTDWREAVLTRNADRREAVLTRKRY